MTIDIEQLLSQKLSAKQERASALKAKAVFRLTGESEGTWSIDCTQSPPKVTVGEIEGSTVKISLDRTVFEQMASGELSPQQAFLSGKVKVEGNLGLSLKLGELLLS